MIFRERERRIYIYFDIYCELPAYSHVEMFKSSDDVLFCEKGVIV